MDDLTLIQDTREQLPLTFSLPTEVMGLRTGDYSVKGYETTFTVERKSLADLIGSLTTGRDRFFRELERMQTFEFRRLLVIGSRSDIEAGRYRSNASPRAILASLSVIEVRHHVPIAYASDPTEGARMIETWARYFVREKMKGETL